MSTLGPVASSGGVPGSKGTAIQHALFYCSVHGACRATCRVRGFHMAKPKARAFPALLCSQGLFFFIPQAKDPPTKHLLSHARGQINTTHVALRACHQRSARSAPNGRPSPKHLMEHGPTPQHWSMLRLLAISLKERPAPEHLVANHQRPNRSKPGGPPCSPPAQRATQTACPSPEHLVAHHCVSAVREAHHSQDDVGLQPPRHHLPAGRRG